MIVMDYFNNKYIAVQDAQEAQVGEYIVFFHEKNNSLGTVVSLKPDKSYPLGGEGVWKKKLTGDAYESFTAKQKEAREKFPLFKKHFRESFGDAIAVTAKYHIFTKQYYFYFYAPQRYNFVSFLHSFRSLFPHKFFLFQVGARDMVRHNPETDDIPGCNGHSLCCKSTRPLPSVDVEALIEQQLQGRDIERLKGRCGKLKCSLVYELEDYMTLQKSFPKQGEKVEQSGCDRCGFVVSHNPIAQTITAQTKEGSRFVISLKQYLSSRGEGAS